MRSIAQLSAGTDSFVFDENLIISRFSADFPKSAPAVIEAFTRAPAAV